MSSFFKQHIASKEGRLSLSEKRKSEESMDPGREMKRPCDDSSLIISPPKYVRSAFVNTTDSVITLKDFRSLRPHTAISKRFTNPKPLSTKQRQLFKPSPEQKIVNPNPSKPTNSQLEKAVLVARANKNPQTPLNLPHLFNDSPKPSATFNSIQMFFSPKLKTESEHYTVSTHTVHLSSRNDSIKSFSVLHQPDHRSPSFKEKDSSFKMLLDERMKAEHSWSSKTINKSAVSVKVEESGELPDCCPQWKDPLDIKPGEDFREYHSAISLSSSSSGHEDDQLPSLKEIMDWSAHEPVTPEKHVFSEPGTPVPKTVLEVVKNKAICYRNSLEQMLKEKEQLQRSKDMEKHLLEASEGDLLRFDEDEKNKGTEEEIPLDQREFIHRFSMTSSAIRDVHLGEEIFIPAKFGQLFNHRTLDMRKIKVTPQNRCQQILFQSHTEHVLSLISAGLLREAYFSFPCQPEVTRWLFQMMSIHPNPIISSRLQESLQTIALSAAQHIVEQHNQQSFQVWIPSVRDIILIFLNMGASFISLFSLEDLQPPFTEGELLEGFQLQETSQVSVMPELQDGLSSPVHNLENVLKYLSLCTALCPKSFTDEELLLLLALVGKIGLDSHFQFLPSANFSNLIQNLLKNFTSWDVQICKACKTLTDLSEDHHNLRRIVYLLPECRRGKLLKQHLSISIISKLLSNTCSYVPSGTDFKLAALKPFLPQMRPSFLLKGLLSANSTKDIDSTLDQQAYYLCYTLLALTNEASNFVFLPSSQRNDLQSLSSQLEKHIKCDMRESEKMLYRSKVKDFVARLYTKWQVLLTRSRPLKGKLYDFWKPPPEDEVPSSPTMTTIKAHNTLEQAEETTEDIREDLRGASTYSERDNGRRH